MPGPTNTLLIEGAFSELVEELARYLDALNKSEPGTGIEQEISPTLAIVRDQEQAEEPANPQTVQKEKDDILKKLVGKANILNTAPEREFTAAYNLLITLSNQSPIRDTLFSRICQYLSDPSIASTPSGPSLAIANLSTIFNVVPLESEARYHVFLAILKVIQSTNSIQTFEALIPQLESNVPLWLSAWQLDEEDARSFHLSIADAAAAASYPDLSYDYLLKALETVSPTATTSPDSRALAKRTLLAAITNPNVTDFTPLTASDAIQALRKSDSNLFELLEIFSSDDYASYTDFLETNSLSSLSIPDGAAEILSTKMRLLTLATIAVSSPNRSVPYATISSALQVPSEDVEMWVIDTIRAGLVEGKLSQLRQEFLVQRATYRVFGEKQWAEIQGRLMVWRRSLESVLNVVRNEKERFLRDGAGAGYGDENEKGTKPNGYGERRQGGGGRRQREQREVDYVGPE